MVIVSAWLRRLYGGIEVNQLNKEFAPAAIERFRTWAENDRKNGISNFLIAANAPCCAHCCNMLDVLNIMHPEPDVPVRSRTGWWNPLTDEVAENGTPEFLKDVPGL